MRFHLDDFPNLNTLCPHINTDRSSEVSSSQLFVLRLCDFWSEDLNPLSIAWRRRAFVAELLASYLPVLDIGDGGRPKGLLKKLSGVSGNQRLRSYTKALVTWILSKEQSDDKIQTIVDTIVRNGRSLGVHVVCSYLTHFHPYFDEMNWANSIADPNDRECARFVTMRKYYALPAMDLRIREVLIGGDTDTESRFLNVQEKYPFVRKEYLLA